MNLYDVIEATGLDPAEFETVAHAEPVARPDPHGDLPGLITGRYRSVNAAIKAWPRVVDGAGHVTTWDAMAYVSRHPAYAMQQLSPEEQERLRADNLAPAGSEPVGQEKVIGRSDPVPYTPPLPPPSPTPVVDAEATEEPVRPEGEPDIEPAPCGNPDCFVLVGAEGRQEIHTEGCPA